MRVSLILYIRQQILKSFFYKTFWKDKKPKPNKVVRFRFSLVDRGGFEPPKSKTSDLQSDPFGRSGTCPCGALRWNRTIDRRIFSPLLYQLSYQGVSRFTDTEIDTYFITSPRGKVFEKRVKKWRPKRGSNS